MALASKLILAAVLGAEAASDGGALAAFEREQQALFEAVAPAVVYIRNGEHFGTGFLVREGLVLTNGHVVGTATEVDVVLLDGRRFKGKVVERAAGNVDLALVQVPVKGVATLVLDALADVRVGGFVATVGHGEGVIWSFDVGAISNIHPVGSERPVIQTQIPLHPGNSGGPLVDRRGRVLGIVTAKIKETNAINFAIRATWP